MPHSKRGFAEDSFHSLILTTFLIVKAIALVNAIIDLSSRFHPDVRMDLLIFLLQLDDVTVIVTRVAPDYNSSISAGCFFASSFADSPNTVRPPSINL